ncbi:PDZ-binding protein, partial [Chytridium lagenaria]
MVCNKCEKKTAILATPDTWKDGSKNAVTGTAGRPINKNKLLSKTNKNKFTPYETKCKLCKGRVHTQGQTICQTCSYKGGLCSMCGVKIMDTSMYKQSS